MTTRIPWSIIYGFFISDESVTLRTCAEKYHLNYDTLRQKASSEAWTWKRQQVFRNTLALMDNRTSEEIAKRNQEQIKFARILLMKATEALKAGIVPQNAKEIRKWIEIGIKIERRCLGLEGQISSFSSSKSAYPNLRHTSEKESMQSVL